MPSQRKSTLNPDVGPSGQWGLRARGGATGCQARSRSANTEAEKRAIQRARESTRDNKSEAARPLKVELQNAPREDEAIPDLHAGLTLVDRRPRRAVTTSDTCPGVAAKTLESAPDPRHPTESRFAA